MRGEIWRVDLGPVKGSEMDGEHYVIVLSQDNLGILNLKVCVPITSASSGKTQIWHVALNPDSKNNLDHASVADVLNLRSLSGDRFMQKLGVLAANDLQEVLATVAIVIGYSEW
jgi:mRNA interferase MazF